MGDLLSNQPFCSNDLMISSECKKAGDWSNYHQNIAENSTE